MEHPHFSLADVAVGRGGVACHGLGVGTAEDRVARFTRDPGGHCGVDVLGLEWRCGEVAAGSHSGLGILAPFNEEFQQSGSVGRVAGECSGLASGVSKRIEGTGTVHLRLRSFDRPEKWRTRRSSDGG